MKISSTRHSARPTRKRHTVILFSAGGFTFAIEAKAVDEIRETAGLATFATRLSKVEHSLIRQGRRYFVVSAARHFRIKETPTSRLMLLAGVPVGVLVDGIDRMQEIHSLQALPEAFRGEERNWYRGLTVIRGHVVPLVRPEAFLSKAEITLLNASVCTSERAAAVTA
ncbi:MAG: chemotaxis protein CheW [Acidobacteria bacterium]|nr:chemotaxis protein CheW [Acidobacteriota bacterium]MBV9147564.1 chemotaxis protein CheW [Acidobacteriota bacterium]MBV9437910.1 chemotaxis protein CheW [Acidobacteriota bacterium]